MVMVSNLKTYIILRIKKNTKLIISLTLTPSTLAWLYTHQNVRTASVIVPSRTNTNRTSNTRNLQTFDQRVSKITVIVAKGARVIL